MAGGRGCAYGSTSSRAFPHATVPEVTASVASSLRLLIRQPSTGRKRAWKKRRCSGS
jgi:hypothetical protein